MTTNYFDNLPISTELQLALSALVAPAVAGGAEAEPVAFTYSYSSTYSPELKFSLAGAGVFINYDVDPGGAGVSRVGSGAGVPSAHDTVVVAGVIAFADIVNSETLDIPLPFEMATDGAHPVIDATTLKTDATATCVITSQTNARVTFGVTGDDFGHLQLRITYQTANAVDPE